jgi:hypothetical protein
LQKVQQAVRDEIQIDRQNFLAAIWTHVHTFAMFNDVEGRCSIKIAQRCKQLETISASLKVVDALSFALRQKIFQANNEADDDFVEFVSNISTGSFGHKHTLDFVWEICCYDGNSVNMKDQIPAGDIILICVETGVLAHYMLLDDAYESDNNGCMTLKEERNPQRETNIAQSMTSSLLEYVNSTRDDFGYGGRTTQEPVSSNGNKTISKREFMEWQRKVVPDLFNNSVSHLLQILFFPPPLFDNCSSMPLFRQYKPTVPVIHSSKELMPRTASKLKKGEVLPIKSAVFGNNYANDTKTNNDSIGCVLTTMFSPELFVFTTISESKFGNEVRLCFAVLLLNLFACAILLPILFD